MCPVRSRPLILLAGPLLAGSLAFHSPARSDPPSTPDVASGLVWLAEQQGRDGSWGSENKLAVTSMAGLALMASGSTPDRGPYAEEVRRATDWVLGCQGDGQAFAHRSSGYSAVHNHGYALLFLTQAYGEGDPVLNRRLRDAIRRGIQASVAAQFGNGGFGYFLHPRAEPPRQHRDMWRVDEASTTISQIQALRGARNAGFSVPRRALERAADYLVRSQHQATGGFVYSIGSDPVRVSFIDGSQRPTFAISAASTAVLHALGTYQGPVVERGIAYLEGYCPPTSGKLPFYYYGHYYAAQIMHMLGGPRGERWMDAILAELAGRQTRAGAWPADSEDTLHERDSRLLNTAWALQIAELRQQHLPIHTR
jgi:hypothetical protein